VSPSLPVLSGADVVRTLGGVGFVQISQRGSHVKLRREIATVIVPLHRELAPGTLRSILRQAQMTVEEFIDLL
jgi:predicted RNA binding protein YcfA (HicA-like mRNA interferase family)